MRRALVPDPDGALATWLMVDVGGDVETPGQPPAWWSRAACAGMPTARFVGEGRGYRTDAAVAVCAGCTVRDACLAYALASPDLDTYGIFGGLTARERRALRTDTTEAA